MFQTTNQISVLSRHGSSSALDAREAGAAAHQLREAAGELVGQLPGMQAVNTGENGGFMVISWWFDGILWDLTGFNKI